MQKHLISKSKLTPVQLQQRLIYTESELAKYKQIVNKYQNDYHYSLIDQLQAENKQLKKQYANSFDLENKVSELTKKLALAEEKIARYESTGPYSTRSSFVNQENTEDHPELVENQDEMTIERNWFHRSLMNHKEENE